MDYSSLILMERDNETGFVTKELGSFKVSLSLSINIKLE